MDVRLDDVRFTRNGREVPPLLSDASRWKTVIVAFPSFMQVKRMDDSPVGFPVKYGPSADMVTLSKDVFTFARPDAEHVVLTGSLESNALLVTMRRVDPSKFPLPSRSIASVSAPLEPLNLSETVKDIIALAFTFLFLGSTGVLFAASMFVLFFVELH